MQNKYTLLGFLSLFLLIAQGCSHSPTVGEEMIKQSDNTKALGKKWNHGEALVKKGYKSIEQGEAMIKKGEKLIDRGHHKIKNGKKMIKNGNKMMQKSESSFQHILTTNENEESQE